MLSVSQPNCATGAKVQSSSLSNTHPSSFTAIIENLFTKLEAYLVEWHPDEDFKKAIEIVSATLQKKSLEDFEITVNADYLLKESSNWYLGPFYKSCAYAITAREDRIGTNEVERWTLITQAFFLLGQAEGLIDKESQRDLQKRISISSKGGEIRAAKLATAKIECARLLQAKMPPGGWLNEDEAIEKIRTELLSFIAKHQLQYAPSRLELNIKKWLKSDNTVRASFAETRSKKIN